MQNTLRTICIITIITAGQTLAASWFSDNFNNGVIDTAHWQYGGDGISESSGVLRLNRNSPDDYIQTAYTYSGNFIINLDIRLNYINWNDMFHGITISEGISQDSSSFNGVSLGFTTYGKLYCGQHEIYGQNEVYGGGFVYGGSNLLGQWQHWTLTKNGNSLSILVNGQPVPDPGYLRPFGGTVPDTVRVYLPGYYSDGDGGGSIGITSSDVDNFSIVPEPCTLLLLGLGAAGAVRKKR
jgi:hypothetical protein